jgi:hypothetical protein
MSSDAPKSQFDSIREALRAMPIDERAEVIVEIFRIISSEFAAMVLEHVQPAESPKDQQH